MFRAGVGLASLVAVFALTGPGGAYDFGTGAEAAAMVKRGAGSSCIKEKPFQGHMT
jgi:hypothetical protein